MESELAVLEGLAGDLSWSNEFNDLYEIMLCNAKSINDRDTLLKMRKISLYQVKFLMAACLEAAIEEGMLENLSHFN